MGVVFFEDIEVVVIDENGKNVFKRLEGFGKGKGFASESSQTISQGGPEAFNVVGLAFVFIALVVAVQI